MSISDRRFPSEVRTTDGPASRSIPGFTAQALRRWSSDLHSFGRWSTFRIDWFPSDSRMNIEAHKHNPQLPAERDRVNAFFLEIYMSAAEPLPHERYLAKGVATV